MPYNSETETFFQAPATVVDSTPDGDTVQEGFDDRLTPAMAGLYADLNLLKADGMISVGIPATTTSRGIGRVATLADMEPDAEVTNGPAFIDAKGGVITPTPTANAVPQADASGKLDGWVSLAGKANNDLSNLEPAANNVIKSALNATGAAPIYACRAWVNFNGASSSPSIRASGNVSSLTDNGVGDYTVNFTAAMPHANYSTVATGCDTAYSRPVPFGVKSVSVTGVRLVQWYMTGTSGQGMYDGDINTVAIFC